MEIPSIKELNIETTAGTAKFSVFLCCIRMSCINLILLRIALLSFGELVLLAFNSFHLCRSTLIQLVDMNFAL